MSPDLSDRLHDLLAELADAQPVETPDRFMLERPVRLLIDDGAHASRRTLALIVGSGLVAAAVAGLVVLSIHDEHGLEPAVPSTSSTGSSVESDTTVEITDASVLAAVDKCSTGWTPIEQRLERLGDLPARVLAQDPTVGPLIPIPNEPAAARIILFDGPVVISCTVPTDAASSEPASDIAAGYHNASWTPRDYLASIEPTWLQVMSRNGEMASDGELVATRVSVVGRVGEDIEAIEIELPDGTTAQAGVRDGWFVVVVDVPAGVPSDQSRLNWTLSNGSRRSLPIDQLSIES